MLPVLEGVRFPDAEKQQRRGCLTSTRKASVNNGGHDSPYNQFVRWQRSMSVGVTGTIMCKRSSKKRT
jgi:hypothetical protein